MPNYGHIVCGYASNPKTDEEALARHIKDILKDNIRGISPSANYSNLDF